ncbi:hypothetical protein EVAR_53667_1, partial [Eumeta japonica]
MSHVVTRAGAAGDDR